MKKLMFSNVNKEKSYRMPRILYNGGKKKKNKTITLK